TIVVVPLMNASTSSKLRKGWHAQSFAEKNMFAPANPDSLEQETSIILMAYRPRQCPSSANKQRMVFAYQGFSRVTRDSYNFRVETGIIQLDRRQFQGFCFLVHRTVLRAVECLSGRPVSAPGDAGDRALRSEGVRCANDRIRTAAWPPGTNH